MQDKKVLVIGCGKIGGRVADILADDYQVSGLRRSPQAKRNNIQYIAADVCDANTLARTMAEYFPEGLDYLIYCLTPSQRNEQGYRETYVDGLMNTILSLPNRERLKRLVFVSSTSVYHQNDDNWVDEDSLCEPKSFSGKLILEAERQLQASRLPHSIVRFSGIYGGNRRQLINQVITSAEEGTAMLSDSLRRSNRIHEDDCVGFLVHLIRKAERAEPLESLYLASDSEPVDLNIVILYLADLLGVTINREAAAQASRRSGNKRCANKRLLDSEYTLRYPSFREGYLAMLQTK